MSKLSQLMRLATSCRTANLPFIYRNLGIRSSNAFQSHLFPSINYFNAFHTSCSFKNTSIPLPSDSSESSSQSDLQNFLNKNELQLLGRDPPQPVLQLDHFQWPHQVQTVIDRKNFSHPTPIQSAAWPVALSGRDVVGVAQTGSGKTLAFLIPAMIKILKKPQQSRSERVPPVALVLTPTRELALQIESVAREFPNIRTVCCYGGASRMRQLDTLDRYQPQLVIGTPGRLNDFLSEKSIDLSMIEYLVLDEADRMLDMGFEPQIRSIVDCLPKNRQTLMWSATWPEEIQRLAQDYLNDYVQINVGSNELSANKKISQNFIFCERLQKRDHLFQLLEQKQNENGGDMPRTLIFAETKQRVDLIANWLQHKGLSVTSLHGDKTQNMRSLAINKFKSGHCNILVATDVAARGLDVADIEYVINFDFPKTVEDYVHRIGRTGRSDRLGCAISFFTQEDASLSKKLMSFLKDCGQEVDPKFDEYARMSYEMKKPQRFSNQYNNNSRMRPGDNYYPYQKKFQRTNSYRKNSYDNENRKY